MQLTFEVESGGAIAPDEKPKTSETKKPGKK